MGIFSLKSQEAASGWCGISSYFFEEKSVFLHSQAVSEWIKKNRMPFYEILSVWTISWVKMSKPSSFCDSRLFRTFLCMGVNAPSVLYPDVFKDEIFFPIIRPVLWVAEV